MRDIRNIKNLATKRKLVIFMFQFFGLTEKQFFHKDIYS